MVDWYLLCHLRGKVSKTQRETVSCDTVHFSITLLSVVRMNGFHLHIVFLQTESLVRTLLVKRHQRVTALHPALSTEDQRAWRVRTTTTKVKLTLGFVDAVMDFGQTQTDPVLS